MSIDLQASVALITSSDPNINRFGTGFVIHRDEKATYLLTCAHVVDDVGGAETIDIGGLKATVVASSDADELDLAVLRVEGLPDKSPLSLRVSGEKDSTFSTAGFQLFGRHYLIRPLQGKLGQSVGLAIRGQAGHIKAWDLKIEDDYQLQPGYSGSPIVDQTSSQVLGVVSHRQGQGERGLAISIEALPSIWPDIPADLLDKAERWKTATTSGDTPPVEVQKESKGDKDLSKPVEIFFSYAHEDEELRDELAKHLSILQRQGIITAWHDREITAGSEWIGAIDDHLNSADIILLLISSDFLASDYCYDVEMTRALERHEAREAVVIPVILRSTKWTSAPFGKLQAIPRNAKPVTAWTDRDEAFLNVIEGIHKVAQVLAARPPASPDSASIAPFTLVEHFPTDGHRITRDEIRNIYLKFSNSVDKSTARYIGNYYVQRNNFCQWDTCGWIEFAENDTKLIWHIHDNELSNDNKYGPIEIDYQRFEIHIGRPNTEWRVKDIYDNELPVTIIRVFIAPDPITEGKEQASTIKYNTSTIRKLLRAAFSDEEFMIFCYDNFKEVYDQFSVGMGLAQKMQRLIEYCEKNVAFEKLLQLVEEKNPAQYRRFLLR